MLFKDFGNMSGILTCYIELADLNKKYQRWIDAI